MFAITSGTVTSILSAPNRLCRLASSRMSNVCFGPERARTEGMRSLEWDSAMTLSLQPVRQG